MARTESVWETAGVDGSYIQTISPTGFDILINGTSKYLNFNTTVGVNGYGIRDNGGTMQFRNFGGSWTDFGSGGGGSGTVTSVASADGSITVNNPTTTVDLTVVKAPILTTARTIGGVSFNGTANIVPQTIQSINEATDTTCFPLFISASGSQSLQPLNNAGFIYNSNTNALTATTFIGALTGNASTATNVAVGGITGLGTGVATFLATPSSANLLSAMTDETGTGALVFANTPTLVTPVLGAATYTTLSGGNITDSALTAGRVTFAGTSGLLSDDTSFSINVNNGLVRTTLIIGTSGGNLGRIQLNGSTSGSTLLIPNVAASGTLTLPAATDTLVGLATTDTLTNKSLTSALINTKLSPTSDDGAPLGDTTHNFSDLFLASGGVINFANGNAAITHSSGILNISSGEFRITSAGTSSTSVPTLASIGTFTNKRITPRTGTTTSSGTPTINTDNVEFYSLTAQAAAITSFTTNLSGTPTDGQTLWIAITDNGTARAITWGASFEASTVALPTTTVISTRLDVRFVWNTVTSKWRCVGTA